MSGFSARNMRRLQKIEADNLQQNVEAIVEEVEVVENEELSTENIVEEMNECFLELETIPEIQRETLRSKLTSWYRKYLPGKSCCNELLVILRSEGLEVPVSTNSFVKSHPTDIMNKLDLIIKNQNDLNNRLDELEKKIDANTLAHTKQLAILKQMVKKNVQIPLTPEFPIKTEDELRAIDKKIAEDFEKYVGIIKIIIAPQGLKDNFHKILDVSLILSYNYDGAQSKSAFKELKHINMAIFEATKSNGSTEKEHANNIRLCFKIHKARHFRKISYMKKTATMLIDCNQ